MSDDGLDARTADDERRWLIAYIDRDIEQLRQINGDDFARGLCYIRNVLVVRQAAVPLGDIPEPSDEHRIETEERMRKLTEGLPRGQITLDGYFREERP